MWKQVAAWLKSNFPIFILLGILVIVTWKNYPWGSSFLGWDSVQPELDFGMNLRRALTSVWVGNQGVGHIGGHGYGTILIQGMIEWGISLVVGVVQTRGVFIFSMLWLGPIGIYFLWKKWFGKMGKFASWGAMLSSLFYLFNLGTVQVFFAPLEAFTVFYGLLPWAILSIVSYLSGSSKKNLVLLLIFQVIFSMIGFIPPQFIAYCIMALALLVGYMIEKRRDLMGGLKKVLTVGTILVIANLYWFAPVVYYSMHGASSYAEAKNNQVSTPDFQYMSEARGMWRDVALMRGFFIDSSDSVIKGEGKFFEIFESWNDYLQGKVESVGYGLFAVSMFGLLMMIVKKGKRSLGIGLLFILGIGWVAIAQAEEPFTTVANLTHQIPVLGQAFRAAFTKFVGLLIFVYAVGFGYGVLITYKLLREKLFVGFVLVIFGVGSMIYYMWPMFNGSLIYERMKVNMPNEYKQVMNFFRSEDKSGRIAYLPSAWMWGWQIHDWGYSGSGFLWYGIEQPILDRAFDVWSPYNETFYNEFSTALYGGSSVAVERVLTKYDVRYVLQDESVIAPGQSAEILRIEKTKKLAEALGWEQKFNEGFLTVWETPYGKVDKFVSAPTQYTFVNGDTTKTRKDVIYEEMGTYVSENSEYSENSERGIIFPFADLMREEVGGIEYRDQGNVISTTVPNDTATRDLVIPGWKVGEIVRVQYEDGEPLPAYFVNPPSPSASDGRGGEPGPRFLGDERPNEGESYLYARVSDGEEWEEYRKNSKFKIQSSKIEIVFSGEPFVYDFAKQGQGSIGNCDVLKRGSAEKKGSTYLADERGAVCDYVVMKEQFTRVPHLMRVVGENIDGRSLKFFLYNMGSERNDIEYLMDKGRFDQTFSLLPWDWDGHYSLNIETRSFGQYAENWVDKVEVRYAPIEKIARATVKPSDQEVVSNENKLEIIHVKKTGTWLYGLGVRGEGLIRLSQGYDEGWVGIKIQNSKFKIQKLEHVIVDGWSNGWILRPAQDNLKGETQIVILFYWPQLLQYLGFVILLVTGVGLMTKRRAKS